MTTISSYCKVYANSSGSKRRLDPDRLSVIVNSNKVEFPNENKFFEFDRVFGPEHHDNNELFSITCNGLIQAFVSGYNTSLLVLGNVDCLKTVLFEGKGLLSYLVDHVTKMAGKELKNQKEVSNLVYMTTPPPPSTKVKHDVTLKLYQVNRNEEITDLLAKGQSSSPPSYNPSFVSDAMDECHAQNLFEHSMVGTSSKRSIKLLNTAFQNTKFSSLANLDHVSLIIEFALTKYIDRCSKPLGCRFRTFVIPTDPLQDYKDTTKPLNMLYEVVTKHFANESSTTPGQATLKAMLAELTGGNCCVNAVTCINHFVSPVMLKLMKLASSLKQITNYPTPAIPQIQLLLKHHSDKLQRLQANMTTEQNRSQLIHNEMKEKLDSLSVEHEKLQNEKNQLDDYTKELQAKYNELINLHAETSSKNVSTTAEKLQMTKQMVDLQLHGNHVQQEAEKSVAHLKNKLLAEEEKTTKLNRDLQFERKMHEELKSKHKHLKTVEEDLNEEYVNLKLNYQHLKESMEGQTKVITELKKTVSQLLSVKTQMTANSNAIQQKQSKKFKEDLQRLSALLADIPSRKDFEWELRNKVESTKFEHSKTANGAEETLIEHKNELSALEDKLFSVKKQLNDKEEAIDSVKRKLAEVSSHFSLVKEEKEMLRRRLVGVETTFQHLSVQYQQRLEQYVRNINEYCLNNRDNEEQVRDQIREPRDFREDVMQMVNDLRDAHKDERGERDQRIKLLSESNQKLFEQCTKTMVAYRLLLGNKENSPQDVVDKMAAITLDLPDDVYVTDYQCQQLKQLETKLKDSEKENQKLKEKLQSSDWHFNEATIRSSLTDADHFWVKIKQQIQSNSKNFQQTLEREKAELLTRCTVAEQTLDSYKEIMKKETERYEGEISYLHETIEQYDRNNNSNDICRQRHHETYGNDRCRHKCHDSLPCENERCRQQQPTRLPLEYHNTRRMSPSYPQHQQRSRYQKYADRP